MTVVLILMFSVFYFIFAIPVYAVCPLCTVAATAGLGVSRWLGIDDMISAIWIGGLIVSSGLWLADWIGKKGWNVQQKEILSVLLFFFFVLPSLYFGKIIGVVGNTFWGIDKVFLGIIVGSLVFLFGVFLDKLLRRAHNDKIYFSFQKVVIPIIFLLLSSFIVLFITKGRYIH